MPGTERGPAARHVQVLSIRVTGGRLCGGPEGPLQRLCSTFGQAFPFGVLRSEAELPEQSGPSGPPH
jgi:hypothetical protein